MLSFVQYCNIYFCIINNITDGKTALRKRTATVAGVTNKINENSPSRPIRKRLYCNLSRLTISLTQNLNRTFATLKFMMKVDEQRIRVMETGWSPEVVVREIVEGGAQEEPFFVMDVGEVVARLRRWRELMPRVEPFYAVKCNDDKLLVRTLAALGTGFDCASRAEIELVISTGVAPDRIIFASPTKMLSHMRYAVAAGVTVTTFDCEEELFKIKQHMPHTQIMLRIRCDATSALISLGVKFGCDPTSEAPRLLELAAVLGLDVVGVSFHVGSGASEAGAYARGLKLCGALFARGVALGLRLRLVDIGGGFPGESHKDIQEISAVINSALETHFPDRGVRVIAEPGRYFAAAAYTLAACVFAKRTLRPADSQEAHTMYFMNDGVYGSFKDNLLCNLRQEPRLLHPSLKKPLPCSLWGPTLDGIDCVLPNVLLPPLQPGAWLLFPDMGAYTIPGAGVFNGIPLPKPRAFVDRELWLALKDLQPFTEGHFLLEERLIDLEHTRVVSK